jgi:hypothetical protein
VVKLPLAKPCKALLEAITLKRFLLQLPRLVSTYLREREKLMDEITDTSEELIQMTVCPFAPPRALLAAELTQTGAIAPPV